MKVITNLKLIQNGTQEEIVKRGQKWGVAWCNGYHLCLPVRRPRFKSFQGQQFSLLLERAIKSLSAVFKKWGPLFANHEDGREASLEEII